MQHSNFSCNTYTTDELSGPCDHSLIVRAAPLPRAASLPPLTTAAPSTATRFASCDASE